MIKVTDLAFGHTEKPLYSEVNFTVGNGQKIGLVGPNGSGKTTLLKLITGIEQESKGKIEVSGSIGWVPQEVKHDQKMEKAYSVKEYINSEKEYKNHEIIKMFSGLELNISLDSDPQKLSGGQKTKLALAKALLSEPDILLLDEPTNFMDVKGKQWVMNFLSRYEKTVILISHDLRLLDKAIDKVLYVNSITKKVEEYKGNYTEFLKLKKEREDLLKRQILVQEKHIKRMEAGLKNMARFTSERGVRQRVQQERRIEALKASLPDLPKEVKRIKIKLPEPAHLGELALRTININKSYGSLNVLQGISLSVRREERIALIGPNGAGKSTFLKIILGIIKADSGEVWKNDALKIGYYSQEFETFDLSRAVVDTFVEDTKTDHNFARMFLGRYMFSGDKVFQRIETLSGGEKTRLSIAMLTAHNYNLLVLDEPTTYLDVLSQRVILEALKEYKGAMLLVSHTPEFVKELVPSRALLFPEEKIVYWEDELIGKVIEL